MLQPGPAGSNFGPPLGPSRVGKTGAPAASCAPALFAAHRHLAEDWGIRHARAPESAEELERIGYLRQRLGLEVNRALPADGEDSQGEASPVLRLEQGWVEMNRHGETHYCALVSILDDAGAPAVFTGKALYSLAQGAAAYQVRSLPEDIPDDSLGFYFHLNAIFTREAFALEVERARAFGHEMTAGARPASYLFRLMLGSMIEFQSKSDRAFRLKCFAGAHAADYFGQGAELHFFFKTTGGTFVCAPVYEPRNGTISSCGAMAAE